MEEWLSYRLGDLLMFSGRTYRRLFELQNAALWPLPLLAPAALAAASIVALSRPRPGFRLVAALLALAWVWVGWSFLWQRYAPINWTMEYIASAFGAQALLLAYSAIGRMGAPTRLRSARDAVGLALLVWGILLHPFAALLFGRPLAQAEIVGIAPDPTAIATLGLALLLPRPIGWAMLAIPVLWLALSALTLWTVGAGETVVPVLALVLCAGGLATGRR